MSNATSSGKARSSLGVFALAFSAMASLLLASLIAYARIESCSRARVVAFFMLLVLSAAMVLAGTIAGAISYRKTRDRAALSSLLFTLVYVALLLYLLLLIG